MKCQQQLSVRSSAGALEAPSGYALRGLQDIKAKRTVYLLRNRTILFATNIAESEAGIELIGGLDAKTIPLICMRYFRRLWRFRVAIYILPIDP